MARTWQRPLISLKSIFVQVHLNFGGKAYVRQAHKVFLYGYYPKQCSPCTEHLR